MRPLSIAAAPSIALLVAVVGSPAPASACTGPTRLYPGQPDAGASEVPTNVEPWLWTSAPLEGASVQLTDSTGMLVDADVEWLEGYALGSYVVIRPHAELEAGTFYDILIDGAETTTGEGYYRFTTGSGPASGEPPALGELRMQIGANEISSSCGDNTFACVGLDYGGTVQVTVTREGGELEAEMIVPIDGALRYARTLAPSAIPFCLELRARDVAGRLGPPSSICSDEAEVFGLDTSSAVTCSGHRVVYDDMFADERDTASSTSGDDGGCSAVPGRGGSPAGGALVLVVLLGLIRRGRIRPSRTA